MAGWVNADEVLARWLADPKPDRDGLTAWIEAAEREIRSGVPSVTARLLARAPEGGPAEPDLRDLIVDVVIELLVPVYTNPNGERTYSSTEGPFGEAVTAGGENPGRLVLSRQQRLKLSPPGTGRSALKTIDLGAGSLARQPPRPWWAQW